MPAIVLSIIAIVISSISVGFNLCNLIHLWSNYRYYKSYDADEQCKKPAHGMVGWKVGNAGEVDCLGIERK